MFLIALERKILLIKLFNFPTSINLNIWWNIGFVLNFLIITQIIVGLVLSCYIDTGLEGLWCKYKVFKEVKKGWLYIAFHSIIPNYIFVLLYLHIFKNLLFPIQSTILIWFTGTLIFLCFVVISFSGYALILGGMSYWAIIVACEIVKSVLGEKISNLLLFNLNKEVNGRVLYKLFTIHYLFSILVLFLIVIHIIVLHKSGGTNSKVFNYLDNFRFSFLLIIKDLYTITLIIILGCYLGFFTTYKFITGDINVTLDRVESLEISVEWYLRIFFIVLRAINYKTFGIQLTLILILILNLYPFLKNMWGIKESLSFTLPIYYSTIFVVILKISSGVFSSSLFLVSIILLLFLDMFLNSVIKYTNYFKYKQIKW